MYSNAYNKPNALFHSYVCKKRHEAGLILKVTLPVTSSSENILICIIYSAATAANNRDETAELRKFELRILNNELNPF